LSRWRRGSAPSHPSHSSSSVATNAAADAVPYPVLVLRPSGPS
jgi:hypothetical protein